MTLKWKRADQNRNNKRTEIERFDWFIKRIQTRVAFGWLSERSGEKKFMPENFLEVNRYFPLTSYCNTIGKRTVPSPYKGFLWRENEESMFWSFYPLADNTNNEHLPKLFFKVIRKSLKAYLFNMTVSLFLFQRFYSHCLDSTRWQYGP